MIEIARSGEIELFDVTGVDATTGVIRGPDERVWFTSVARHKPLLQPAERERG